MNSNGKYLIGPIVFISLIVISVFWVMGFIRGEDTERRRIYDRCLELNGTMIHRDAVAQCKEIVKMPTIND